MSGSWRKACDHLAALSSWNLMSRKDETLAMLQGKLQARPSLETHAVHTCQGAETCQQQLRLPDRA